MSALQGEERSRPAWVSEVIAMLALSWPMILTNVAQVAMTATDVAMMGRLGPATLAAGSLGTSFYFVPFIFGMGLMIATSPMIAAEFGRRRHSVRDVRRTVRQGLWIAAGVCVPIWILLWNAGAILAALGQDAKLFQAAGDYLRALQWSILPFYWYLVLRSFISALERPGWALAIALFAVGFNAFANWCLIFGNLGFPALGIVGSGLATTASSLLMFAGLAFVVSFDKQFRRFRLFGRFWVADASRLRALLRLGLPVGGLLTFETTLFSTAAFLMGLIGESSLAAHVIAMQISSISFMIPMALGQAATVRVGLAFGARDRKGVGRAGWTAFIMSAAIMCVTAATMIFFPLPLIRVFIDISLPDHARVVSLAVVFVAFAGLFQIVDGAQAVAGGMLRGVHDTKYPMIFAALGYWGVGIPLGIALAFGLRFQGAGIWIGLCLGLGAVAGLLLLRWLRRDDFIGATYWQHPRYPAGRGQT